MATVFIFRSGGLYKVSRRKQAEKTDQATEPLVPSKPKPSVLQMKHWGNDSPFALSVFREMQIRQQNSG